VKAEAKLVPSKRWPFNQWDSARAYTYNLRPMGRVESLMVHGEKGWISTIAQEKQIDPRLGKKALSMLRKTNGEMLVSKCPFPRHAIVLFAGQTPVGSINVCFECTDLLVWPPYHKSPKTKKRKEKAWMKYGKIYDRVFPSWKRLFERDIGFATDWKRLPGAKLERARPR